jgi:hypothetical protein
MDTAHLMPRLRCLAHLSPRDADMILRLVEQRTRLAPTAPGTQHCLRRIQVYRRVLGLPQAIVMPACEPEWLATG